MSCQMSCILLLSRYPVINLLVTMGLLLCGGKRFCWQRQLERRKGLPGNLSTIKMVNGKKKLGKLR